MVDRFRSRSKPLEVKDRDQTGLSITNLDTGLHIADTFLVEVIEGAKKGLAWIMDPLLNPKHDVHEKIKGD